MEVAIHSALARTHTAPAVHARLQQHAAATPSLMQNQSHQSHASAYSTYSHPSTRSSDSTQTQSTQHSSFSTFGQPPLPTPTPMNGGPIEASDNVLNKRADKDTSLFQICLNLQQRLREVRGFETWLNEAEEEADEDTDPVTLLWRTFRRGYPLMTIYNASNPTVPLELDENRFAKAGDEKKSKAATFKFIQACIQELSFPSEEMFIISDLYGDDTTGFVKVAKVVNRVLDFLAERGIISSGPSEQFTSGGAGSSKKTHRQHIIHELVETERTYVKHLELLQEFKKLAEESGVIPGDAVHDIFLNLNALLDFQRRFLIRVEQTNAQPEEEQNWGKLFVLYKDAFKVYEPYIANQRKSEEVAMREFDKLRESGGSDEMRQMVESPTHFTSFLLKPFQRLSKYPLLLRELQKNGDLDEERLDDISTGIEAAQSVLHRTNAAIDREERIEALEELKGRVEDWKGHRIEGFGDLLLHGTFTVLKGDSINSKDPEREYKIYLFEMILLCCKEMNPNKQKKVMGKPVLDRKGKPKLQLKGRIFMQNVTETISIGKPGSYTCQIFWKGDPGIENFIIRFTSEETMKKWANQVNTQRREWQEKARTSASTKTSNTSATEFTYMMDQNMENPYREQDDDDDDDIDTVVPPYSAPAEYSIRTNSSNPSLRSRSATNESMSESESRAPPPRFPMGFASQPLTLRTQLTAGSPNALPADSYFSPSVDSPISSRTSSSSAGMFPFPRQPAPTNGWNGEEQNRFTAPAIGRNASQNTVNGYPASARNLRPSLPANAGSQHNAILAQNRFRSVSSPDIQNPLGPGRRSANGPTPPVPDLPPFPTHYAYTPGIVNRSQSNSPHNGVTRTATQSPNLSRPPARAGPDPGASVSDYPGGPARYDPRHVPVNRTLTPSSSLERTMTPASTDSRTVSPPLPSTRVEDVPIPSQLKVKVHCPSAGSTMTLVVSTNISYQSLKDRIDAKLQRSTNVSLSSGQVKLKYLDDDDYVNIQSDEDVQTAFETWKEQQRDQIMAGQLGEIELFCQR